MVNGYILFLILMFFGENKNHTYIKAVYNA